MKNKINILGAEYTVSVVKRESDPILKDKDGYVDHTVKKIVVADPELETDIYSLKDLKKSLAHVIRHEIVHAFFIESGLNVECHYAESEECVDWIAAQAPKMCKLWQEMGIL